MSAHTPEGKCTGVVIFDPKYRAGSSLANGLRDLHVYRDALLDDAGSRVVKGAVALAPRNTAFPEMAGTIPQDRPTVLTARPGHDTEVFVRLLEAAERALS